MEKTGKAPSGGKPKVYIATKLENHAQHNELRDLLVERGIDLSYDWTAHGPVWERGEECIRTVANLEARGVLKADLCIVLWPGGRGTHVEMGIAIGAGVPVLFYSPEPDRHFHAHPDTCAFYHAQGVTRISAASMTALANYAAQVLREMRLFELPQPA